MNLLSKLKRKLQNIGKTMPEGSIFNLEYKRAYKCGQVKSLHFQPFAKPKRITDETMYLILSFYIEWIEKRMHFEHCSPYAIETLDKMLDDLGFIHLYNEEIDETPIPLYTLVNYNTKIQDYFEWFTANVSLKDIMQIYENAGLEFKDPEEVYENYLKHLELTHKKTTNEI